MSRYCLDASAYGHFQKGSTEVVDLVDAALELGVPAIVLGELRAGFRSGHQRQRNEEELMELLANPIVKRIVVDADTSHHYADIIFELRQKGTPLPTNDVWIAATAAQYGLTVLTFDEHFNAISAVPSLVLERG